MYGLMEQFRILSNYLEGGSDLSLTGFVFPSSEETCVTEVTIFWQKSEAATFHFNFVTKYLPKEGVKDRVQAAVEKAMQLEFQPIHEDNQLCYLKLSKQDIETFEYENDGKHFRQVQTWLSILLTNDKVYIKLCPKEVSVNLFTLGFIALSNKCDNTSFPLLIPELHGTVANSFVYPALPYQPLSYEEAKECLADLVKKVSSALQKIHHILRLAHLDVRLPNICFREKGEPVLIDPDRVDNSDMPAYQLSRRYESTLYQIKDSQWCLHNVDWRQLGFIIVHTIYDDNREETGDEFIDALLNQGNPLLAI